MKMMKKIIFITGLVSILALPIFIQGWEQAAGQQNTTNLPTQKYFESIEEAQKAVSFEIPKLPDGFQGLYFDEALLIETSTVQIVETHYKAADDRWLIVAVTNSDIGIDLDDPDAVRASVHGTTAVMQSSHNIDGLPLGSLTWSEGKASIYMTMTHAKGSDLISLAEALQ